MIYLQLSLMYSVELSKFFFLISNDFSALTQSRNFLKILSFPFWIRKLVPSYYAKFRNYRKM